MALRVKSEMMSPPPSGTAMARVIRQILLQVEVLVDLVLFMFGILFSCLVSFIITYSNMRKIVSLFDFSRWCRGRGRSRAFRGRLYGRRRRCEYRVGFWRWFCYIFVISS